MTRAWALAVGASLLVLGCGPAQPLVFDMANVKPTAPTLLASKKLDRTLYLVLDASQVQANWDLSQPDQPIALEGFQLFVTRDLAGAMAPYFAKVEVVTSESELPRTPHAVGNVKVERVVLHDFRKGESKSSVLEMTWSFSVRASETEERAFSYAGTAPSSANNPSFEVACAQMVEAALLALNKKWIESDGLEAVRKWTEPRTP